MENKRIDSMYTVFNSLVSLLHNVLLDEKIKKEEIFYSLFGIIVLDLIVNKEDLVKNTEGIVYESLMSDSQLENILMYLNIENIDKDKNGASIYATIRNKLAHGDYYLEGDYLIFNINDTECKVNLRQFICYYMDLTQKLNCRIKGNKFVKYQLINKGFGKFDNLLENDNDIREFLKMLTYKEYIFRRLDNKELSTYEKDIFTKYVYDLGSVIKTEKEFDKTLYRLFNNGVHRLDIKNHKLKKVTEEEFENIKKVINRYNKVYDYDKEYIENIIFLSAEDIYKLISTDYEHVSIKYGLANIKIMLDQMIKSCIYDYNEFALKQNERDMFYILGLPDDEMIISIILSIIYFGYGYPLDKLFRDNKMFVYNEGDFNFNKLNLSEIKPSINKLYDTGKDNLIKQVSEVRNGLLKPVTKLTNKIACVEEQLNNVKVLYEKCTDVDKKKEYNDIINDLSSKLSDDKNELQKSKLLFMREDVKLECIKDMFENTDINFYNYSIITGIRNSIAHGNINCKKLLTNELQDVEIEFIDLDKGEEQFKLNIKLSDLMSLIEEENICKTNEFFNKKKLKNYNI